MKKEKNLPKVTPVKLKEFLGMKPGIWLTILYSIILLVAVFLICFLPGIKHGSMRVTFTSNAYNAAVYIDGNYSGGTPYTVKVPSGKHSVEYKVNGCSIDNLEIEVRHPVFLTWLFPRKMQVNSNAVLTEEAYCALTKEFFQDLVTYSAILEYSDIHRYPKLFTNYAKCISTYKNADLSLLKDYAVRFISTDEMLEDAKEAFEILGIQFTLPVKNTPSIYTGKYHLETTPVTEYQYSLFTQANPKWSKDNVKNLVNEGLADSYYLEGTGTSKMKAVVNVSYYAAQAYCKWMSEQTGMNYSLPTEGQWISTCSQVPESFSSSLIVDLSSEVPTGMIGGVWEMTKSSYIPYGETDEMESFLENLETETEIIIKGGSYISQMGSVDEFTVGISTKSLCSDYMGFRVAIND